MKNDFQLECDNQTKRIAERLEQLYYGSSDELDNLIEQIEELGESEPEEPEQWDDESDEDYDKRYDAWSNAWNEWKNEIDFIQDQIDDLESETLEAYLNDNLELSYIVNADKTYESVRVWITTGGPSIYVDTDKGAVILNWGGTHSEYYLSMNVRNAIDDIFREQYNWN